MADFVTSLAKSSGAASIKSAFDFWNGNFKTPPVPVPPVLSSQYKLEFFIGDSDEPIHLFDIDNITKTLVTSQKKSFRPYGFSHKINLMNYEGWDIKITGKKTNPALNYLVQKVYELSAYPSAASPNLLNGPIVTPLFTMTEIIEQYPDENYMPRIQEMYVYSNMVITGYDEEVPDDNMPLTFTLSLFARSRRSLRRENESWDYNTKDSVDFEGKSRVSVIDRQIIEAVDDIMLDNKEYFAN